MGRNDSGGLARVLGLGQATSVVVGIVIGSGIFLGANRVAQGVDDVFLLFAVWIGAGVLTLLGALTYAEFGSVFPHSGGDYVYARESLGAFWGFFNGWATFAINYPASVAALCLAWAGQLDTLKPDSHLFLFGEGFSERFTALALLAIFTVINYLGVRQAGWTQLAVTGAKIILILGLILAGFLLGETDADNVTNTSVPGGSATIAVALVGALWAYDGWTGVTRVAGEVKEPQRNVPRSLIYGILAVIAIYVLLTLVYLAALGLDGMRGDDLPSEDARAIAGRAADVLFGSVGRTFVAILILVSILSPINGLTLAGPRLYYAMARDGLFPRALARVHEVHRVPHVSIFVQGALTAVLILFFTFEQLTSYVVLAGWVSYMITGIGLIRFRRLAPDVERPYRVPGYPWIPLIFVTLSAVFLGYLFYDSLQDTNTLLGLPEAFVYFLGNVFVFALAWPVYQYFVKRDVETPFAG